MAEVIFFLAAIGVVGGAVGVVVLRNPFYTVLALVVHLLSLAALFLTLRAEFIAAAQVVVYAGAVMVLYVFVVAYVGGGEPAPPPGGRQAGELRGLAVLFAGALFVCLCIATLGSGLQAIGTEGAQVGPGYGTPEQIGELLLNRFLLPFELASYLLLLAAVGAVVLASRRRGVGEGAESEISVAQLLRPRGTGTMAEAVRGLPAAQADSERDEREAREGSEQGEERDGHAEDGSHVSPGASDRGGP